jgi:hypothetical protein
MRRALLSLSVTVAAALLVAPTASAATQPAELPAAQPAAPSGQNLTGTVVQPSLFGMHVFNVQNGVWPTIPFGSLRLWDDQTTWSSIETAPHQFTWTTLDSAVANAQSHGMKDILLVLAGTPLWASDDPKAGGTAGVLPGGAGMPTSIADWDEWVTQVVTRFKGKITAYQVWNEANLSTFSNASPAEMAQLTKHAYDIIKSIDPAATVVAPSTGTRLGGPFKKFYPAYLQQLKALGWPVDVWSAHTYPASLGTPVDRAALAQMYKDTLAAAGAPDKPIWDTENNFGLAGPGPENPDQNIEGQKAADWTARAYLDALRLGVSRVYWYAWGPFNNLVGIQMNDGSPGAKAYATLENWIVGTTFGGCNDGNKVTCTFTKAGTPSKIVWTQDAKKAPFAVKGFTKVCSLDGTCKAISSKKLKVSSPVLLTN